MDIDHNYLDLLIAKMLGKNWFLCFGLLRSTTLSFRWHFNVPHKWKSLLLSDSCFLLNFPCDFYLLPIFYIFLFSCLFPSSFLFVYISHLNKTVLVGIFSISILKSIRAKSFISFIYIYNFIQNSNIIQWAGILFFQ